MVDRLAGRVDFGVGSGIVWDSDPDAEYEECLLKARVLCAPVTAFELLETLRWSPDAGFLVLERHLARLADSARYFGIDCSAELVRSALDQEHRRRRRAHSASVCWSDQEGSVRAEHATLMPSHGDRFESGSALRPIDSTDPLLFHKTTKREST